MNGPGLLRRVLKDPLLKLQYDNPRVTPLAARPVLEAAYTAIACQDAAASTFKLDPDAHGHDTLTSIIAALACAVGAEEEVAQMLERLVQVGLLQVFSDNSLGVPKRFVSAKTSTSAKNGTSGGRPRAGETKAEARVRRADELAAHDRSQGALPLAIAGGNCGAVSGPISGNVLAQQLRQGFRVINSGLETEPVFEPKTQTQNVLVQVSEQVSNQVSGRAAAAAAAVLEDSLKKTAAAASLLTSREGADACEDANLDDEEPETEPGFEPEDQPPAHRLASRAAARFGWNRHFAKQAPAVFQGYLAAGYTEYQLTELVDETTTPVNSAAYFSKRLFARYGAPVSAGSTGSAPVVADDPRVLADPDWAKAPPVLQSAIAAILKVLELPKGGEQLRQLSFNRQYRSEAFDAVAAKRPGILALLDWQPPRMAVG